MKKYLKKKLLHLKHFINKNPKLKKKVLEALNHFPKLQARLKRIGTIDHSGTLHNIPISSAFLSPRAKQIYSELCNAVAQTKANR